MTTMMRKASSRTACYFALLLFQALYTSSVQSFVILKTRGILHIRHSSSLVVIARSSASYHLQATSTNNSVDEYNNIISWRPSRIEISNLSHQYPVTLWRKLTSSEPRRPFALEDVNLTLLPNFVLLVGDSSSGKSTLLKLIMGLETVSSGNIQIVIEGDDMVAVPVLLEQRPVYSNRPQTVQTILQEKLKRVKAPMLLDNEQLMKAFLQDLCDTMDLSLGKKGSDLSPSEVYRCAMAEASLESMLKSSEMMKPRDNLLNFPAPILFLDEWMDLETSTVVQNVQSSIQKLVERGAIVVSITHKPNLYKQSEARTITLRRGKVVGAT